MFVILIVIWLFGLGGIAFLISTISPSKVDTSKFDQSQIEVANSLSRIETKLGTLDNDIRGLKTTSADKTSVEMLNTRINQVEEEINSLNPVVVQEVHNNFFNRYNINLFLDISLAIISIELIKFLLIKYTKKETKTAIVSQTYNETNYHPKENLWKK